MKKIFYIVLSLMLIIPFSVKAEENTEQRSITVTCSEHSAVVSEGELYSCSGSVTKKSSDTSAKVEINNGSNKDLVIGNITDGVVLIDFGDNNTGSFSFTVTNKVPVLKDAPVALGITAIFTFDEDQKETIIVDRPVLTLKASTSSNPSNPTKPSNPSPSEKPTTPTTPNKPTNPTNPSTSEKPTVTNTSKGITNPNTADMNILQLSLVGILFIFIMILSIRKINLLKNSR